MTVVFECRAGGKTRHRANLTVTTIFKVTLRVLKSIMIGLAD
jgi:hypothetical protein